MNTYVYLTIAVTFQIIIGALLASHSGLTEQHDLLFKGLDTYQGYSDDLTGSYDDTVVSQDDYDTAQPIGDELKITSVMYKLGKGIISGWLVSPTPGDVVETILVWGSRLLNIFLMMNGGILLYFIFFSKKNT